ncbi:MAG: hypothetical protein HY862_20885 [Chloroflexi bacterium]|nr:hypothetical protein [Chloroflexota bacterium]
MAIKKMRLWTLGLSGAAALLLILMLLVSYAFPVLAAPRLQGTDYPTMTPANVEIDPVAVEEVGGNSEPVVFLGETKDGFTIGDTTVVSDYPNGATFTVTIQSEQELDQVTLVIRYPHGSGTRVQAGRGTGENEWVATLYDTDDQPPWLRMDFFWRVIDLAGGSVETTAQNYVYSDPTRVWYHAANDQLELYWFGWPEEFAQAVMHGMAVVQERWLLGFGEPLSFRPIAVVFSDADTFGEFSNAGAAGNSRRAGFTSNDLGITVQRFPELGFISSCPRNPPPEDQTIEWAYDYMTEVITHEVTHLYQFDKNVGGPTWFVEGGATWFSLNSIRAGTGLRDHNPGQDILTLQGDGPGGGGNIPNGCNAPGYWMGASFIQWIYGQYGMEGIHQWFDLISRNTRMNEALIAVTGKNLAQLEPEWRAYLGYNPEPFVPPTQEYQFPPTVTPFGQ